MLTKTDIRNKTNAVTYTRGLDIYRAGKINDFTVEEENRFDSIKAEVKGSVRNRYEVSAVYDVENDMIEDTYCDCPAFSGYNGICKHCVAVLLEYTEYVKRQDKAVAVVLKKEESLAKLQSLKGLKNHLK
jgi:uncharacterized Zn finger protein